MSHEIGSHECWHFLRPYAKNLQLLKLQKQGGVVQVTPKRHLVFSLPCAVPFPYQTKKADFHHGSSDFAARTPRCLGYVTLAVLHCFFQSRGCPMCRSGTTEWPLRIGKSARIKPQQIATSEVWGRYRRGSSESSLTCHHEIFGEVKCPDSKPLMMMRSPFWMWIPKIQRPNGRTKMAQSWNTSDFCLVCYQQDTLPHRTKSSRNESLKGVSNFWIVSC